MIVSDITLTKENLDLKEKHAFKQKYLSTYSQKLIGPLNNSALNV